jgi:UDP-2,3-diacylglucosamine pyrophosphatase LpxH
MYPAKEVIVISDLHLAAERGKGLFQADEQLAEFLNWIHENLRRCCLVLNGDIFDFLVNKQKVTVIDLDDAASAATAIVRNHREIFEALSLLVSSEQHELIILGGNHDPELSLPTVQREIERHLNPSSSRPSVRWLTNGEGMLFQIGEVKVLIEHGDQYDAWNWIDHEALRRVICLASRNISFTNVYTSPPGSQLVINRLNPLRARLPWLATLQPLNAAILPLVLEVILPALSTEDRSTFLRAAREFCNYNLRSLAYEALRKLKSETEYWAEDDGERQVFIEWLDQYERDEDTWGVVGDTVHGLTRMLARLRYLVTTKSLRRISSEDNFYNIDVPDNSIGAVRRLFEKGTNLIVHGHTHSAKSYLVEKGLYMNSGTWAQLTRLPNSAAGEQVWMEFLADLKDGRADSFGCPTYVHISEREGKTSAALFEWQKPHPVRRSAWSFASNCWQSGE